MFSKILNFIKGLDAKRIVRGTFFVAAAVSVVLGYNLIDGSKIAYNTSVFKVNYAYGNAGDIADSTDISVTDEIFSLDDVNDLLLNGTSSDDYTMKPLNITTTEETVTEVIEFEYKTVYSNKLAEGKIQVKKGSNGEKKIVYSVTTVNGVVTNRVVESSELTVKPVTQVKTVGTKKPVASTTKGEKNWISGIYPDKPIELDKDGAPVNYSKLITGKASAYCGCCDGNSTAYFGKNTARPGYVAVNPKQIPYGTKLYIVCNSGTVYGYAIAADTGGFARNGSGRVVDLRMPTGSKCNCNDFGVRNVKIYVLE